MSTRLASGSNYSRRRGPIETETRRAENPTVCMDSVCVCVCASTRARLSLRNVNGCVSLLVRSRCAHVNQFMVTAQLGGSRQRGPLCVNVSNFSCSRCAPRGRENASGETTSTNTIAVRGRYIEDGSSRARRGSRGTGRDTETPDRRPADGKEEDLGADIFFGYLAV